MSIFKVVFGSSVFHMEGSIQVLIFFTMHKMPLHYISGFNFMAKNERG